jgi:hypothetical protein
MACTGDPLDLWCCASAVIEHWLSFSREPVDDSHFNVSHACRDRDRDPARKLTTRPATQRNQHSRGFLLRRRRRSESGIEDGKRRPDGAVLLATGGCRRECSHNTAVNQHVRFVTAQAKIVHAHDDNACVATGRNPPRCVSRERVVDDQQVDPERSNQPRWRPIDHIAPKRQRNAFGVLAATHVEQRPDVECVGQRSAADEMSEAAPGARRRAEQDAEISAGSHAVPR